MEEMKQKMILWMVGMILERLTEDQVRDWAIMGINMLRGAVEESANKYDDLVVLPLLDVLEGLVSSKDPE